ncbi:MAG TPA: D-alanyl-D-alanine carboxypeptidase family protein [Polyangiales bacterium]|nr:D-alanyl-D-alanine carboxypeptidase family protein [Polyangiales bacterium]
MPALYKIPRPTGFGTEATIISVPYSLGEKTPALVARPRGPLSNPDPQLTYEEFRQLVLDKQIARKSAQGKAYFPPVPPDELETVEGNYKMRRGAAGRGRDLLAAARAALADAKSADDAKANKTSSLGVCSAYRAYDYDAARWRETFKKLYDKMRAKSLYVGQEHGTAAANYMLQKILPLKAPPGFSNHSNGKAVDFRTMHAGTDYVADSEQREGWRTTWLHGWLVENAADYGFKPLASEEWHWDYDGNNG